MPEAYRSKELGLRGSRFREPVSSGRRPRNVIAQRIAQGEDCSPRQTRKPWRILRKDIQSPSLRSQFAAILTCLLLSLAQAAEPRVLADFSYVDNGLTAQAERAACKLDLYLPPEGKDFPTLVWLHGGGLTGGSKSSEAGKRMARRLAGAGIAVAMVEYRMNPAVRYPVYVTDAASAFAWVRQNISSHGGDPRRLVLGGHSAGAYLALLAGLDDRFLAGCGLDASALAGIVALSSQTSTHFTVRTERGLGERIVVDDAAPLYHASTRPFPLLIVYAGEDMVLRVEENRLLVAALREAGTGVEERLFEGRTHSTIFTKMADPDDAVAAVVIRFIKGIRPTNPK